MALDAQAHRKLIIAFDCDDVLVLTSPKLLKAYDKKYGTNVDPAHLYEDHPSWGASHADAVQRILQLHGEKVVTAVAPLSETKRLISKLHKAGHELHVITGRHDFQAKDTLRQLDKHFPGIFKSVEFTSYFGAAHRDKACVCKELGVDIFIDDLIDHCNIVQRSGIKTILYGDYPWNSSRAGLEQGIVCCPTMDDVYAEVQRVSQG